MEIDLGPHQEEKLRNLADREGKPAEVLAGELLEEALAAKEQAGELEGCPDPAYEASRTDLGRILRALRRRHIEQGGRLSSVEEINREVAEGRGERRG